jgi:spermidine/putrescine transport system substrate-binding protein
MKYIIIIIITAICSSFNLYAQEDIKTLRILSWEDFFSPKIIAQFEKENNIRIEIIPYYSSNIRDIIFKNKTRNNIDIILSTQSGIIDYINNGFLVPLEFDKLNNYKHMDTSFTINRIVKIYSISMSYSTLGIAYRNDKNFTPPKNWTEFIIPNKKLKGRIDLIEDADDIMDIFLLGAGNDLKNYTIEDLFHAAQLFDNFAPSINKIGYNTEGKEDTLMTGKSWLAPVYGFQFHHMAKETDNISFIYPDNSTKILRDNIGVNIDSKYKDLSFKFIDFLMNPKVAAANFEHNLYTPLNKESHKYIPQDLMDNNYIYPDLNNINIITDEIEDVLIQNKKYYFYNRIIKKNGVMNEVTE